MGSRLAAACVTLAGLFVAGCSPGGKAISGEKPAGAADAASVKDIHDRLIRPGSDALFEAEAAPPETDEGWRGLETAAQHVADGAARLQTGKRVRDQGDWLKFAKAVEENAKKSIAAARARDPDALLLADGNFLVHCEDCHNTYRDVGGGMMNDPTK
jgi:hypothetical protein